MEYFVLSPYLVCWEMLKEEFGVFGDILKVSKVFVQ